MNKTSVYLDDQDLAELRRLAQAMGKSQSELLRDGIRALGGHAGGAPRPGSIGAGSWPRGSGRRWHSDELASRRGLR